MKAKIIISKNDEYTYRELAVHAVGYAEALVEELKKKMETK